MNRMTTCPYHPEYIGIDAPDNGCETCLMVWHARYTLKFDIEDDLALERAENPPIAAVHRGNRTPAA